MFDTTNPGDGAFDSHTESAVGDAAVLAQIKIPFVGFFGQTGFVDALEQQVVTGHAF